MKNLVMSMMISFLAATGSYAQASDNGQDDKQVLDFYRQFSTYTDPGDYAYLFENLPDSLPALCSLIRSQFIHPYGELNRYQDRIPKERWDEMYRYPSVYSILAGLVSYDAAGLTTERKPEDRLILGCQQQALLLASVMKYRGIPARVRYGHATYLIPDFHTSHTICEVWDEEEKRWMLVDPSTDKVDFNPEEFDFSSDAWLQLQRGEIDPDRFGIPGRYSGLVSIAAKVNTDLASLLGTEYPINRYAPMLEYAFTHNGQLSAVHIETLNTVCDLMQLLDAAHISRLQEIFSSNPDLQITMTLQAD